MKKSIPLMVVILIFVAGMVWAEKAEDWFNEGVKALEAEDYEKTIKCFKKTLAKNPDFSLDDVYGGKGMKWFIKEKVRTYLRRKPINLPSFEKSAKRLLEKTKMLREKAQTFDQKETLTKLGINSINGVYYRFDEHINEAICESTSLKKDKIHKDSVSFNFEFNSSNDLKLKPKKGKFALERGLIKFRYVRGGYLESIGELKIDKDNIGEIELRIKLNRGGRIELGWCKDDYVEWGDPNRVGKIMIEAVPGGNFHTYKINAKNVLRGYLHYGDIIKKIFLVPTNIINDEVEIDYIRFLSKREKYSTELYGEAYETIAQEMRKVLFTKTSLSLKYTLNVPEDKSFLTFGMGILDESDPVTFKVVVKSKKTQEEIFSEKIISADTWHDVKIDLLKWSGKSVEVSLQTDSVKGNIAFWSNPIMYTLSNEKLNVIILLEDALRADHLSCYGYSRKTSPAKDSWIKNGVLFQNAFAQALKTRPSCPTIMTSLYPTATGVWNFSQMLQDSYLTLAEIMRSQGFATASFVQNGNAGPCAGLHQGFSNLFGKETMGSRAEHVYSEKLYEWIKKHSDRNTFIYLHLLDPHGEYDPPKPFDSWYRNRKVDLEEISVRRATNLDPEWIKNPTLEGRRLLYDGEIRHNDFCFKNFLEKLKEYKSLEETLVVFIADHGEHMGEHDLWNHISPGYIQVLNVPLLMVYPEKFPADIKISQPVQLIDVMPTILDLAKIDQGNLLIEGDSLISLIQGKDLSFWDNRLSVSEEFTSKDKDKMGGWASLFYKNWHILNSSKLSDDLSIPFDKRYREKPTKHIKESNKKIHEMFFSIRVFNYLEDRGEEHYLKSLLPDMFFNYKVKDFLREFQDNNIALWKTLTKSSDKTIKYDHEVLEQLRALGYLDSPEHASPPDDDSDLDGIYDRYDNCPHVFNPTKEDTYPPGGNGIGDACECEGDFDCDGDVDESDAALFKADFGRNQYKNLCTNHNPCNGDFDCDGNVDWTDAEIFKSDFGRNALKDPCPPCAGGDWCVY